MNPARRLFALALLLDLTGAGAALVITARTWQTIVIQRPRPLNAITVQLNGRTIDGALLGAALVALAGIVAVLATRGVVRRGVGALIALGGILLAWRALAGAAAVSHARAIDLTPGRVGISGDSPISVTTHPAWPALTAAAAVLVVIAGALIAIFGSRWSAMSSRYEAPSAVQSAGDEALWTALDRGDDPTARTET